MLEFLYVDLHNQCDNVVNQCYFIFCIVVHNGADTLLLDFLWAHLNLLDWPIKSSDPNNVCDVIYMNIFICIYT